MLWEPDIIANVTLLSTEQGGRHGATPTSRFGCPCEIQGEMFDGRMDLSAIGSVAPGDRFRVPIRFLRPDLVRPRLRVGFCFSLWEGSTIGYAVVIELRDCA